MMTVSNSLPRASCVLVGEETFLRRNQIAKKLEGLGLSVARTLTVQRARSMALPGEDIVVLMADAASAAHESDLRATCKVWGKAYFRLSHQASSESWQLLRDHVAALPTMEDAFKEIFPAPALHTVPEDEKELRDLRGQVKDLTNRLNDAKREREVLKAKLDAARAAPPADPGLQAKVKAAEESLSRAGQTIAARERVVGELTDQLAARDRQDSQTDTALRQLRAEKVALTKAVADTSADADRLTQRLSKVERELEVVGHENAAKPAPIAPALGLIDKAFLGVESLIEAGVLDEAKAYGMLREARRKAAT